MIRRRNRRGYSVVELAVVAVVATGIVLGLVRWLIGVGSVAQAGLRQTAGSELLLAQTQLRDDLQRVRFCTANGTDARVRLVEPGTLVLATDGDADGDLETVGWRITQGRLERSTALLGAGCSTGELTTWVIWADNLEASSAFSVVADGVAVPGGTDGLCPNEFEARCAIDAIGAEFTVTGETFQSLGGVFDVAGGRDVISIGSLTGQLVPGRVAGVSTQAGDGQVTLSWQEPSTNGWAISDYVVEYSTNAGADWITHPDGTGTATTATITGLVNGLSHQFRVSAANVNGDGVPSAPILATPFPPAGTLLWSAGGGAQGSDTFEAVDLNGSSVAAGGSYTGDAGGAAGVGSNSAPGGAMSGLPEANGQDALVVGFAAASGQTLWATSGGGSGADTVHAVAAGSGTVIAAGSYEATPAGFLNGAGAASGSGDAFIAALGSTNGSVSWVLRGGSSGADAAYGVTLSADGSIVYVTGTYTGTPTGFLTGVGSSAGQGDVFVVAVQVSNGQVLWRARAGGTGDDAALAAALDPTGGTVYLAGRYAATPTGFLAAAGAAAGGQDAFVAAVSTSSGQALWSRRGGGAADDEASALYADTVAVYAGGLYRSSATGFLSGLGTSTGGTDAWVGAFSRSSGSIDWTARGGSGSGAETVGGLAVIKGRVAVGGSYSALPNGFLASVATTDGSPDGYAALLGTEAGTGLWAERGGAPGPGAPEGVRAVAAAPAGWLYLAGTYLQGPTGLLAGLGAPAGGGDAFVVMISPGPVDGR